MVKGPVLSPSVLTRRTRSMIRYSGCGLPFVSSPSSRWRSRSPSPTTASQRHTGLLGERVSSHHMGGPSLGAFSRVEAFTGAAHSSAFDGPAGGSWHTPSTVSARRLTASTASASIHDREDWTQTSLLIIDGARLCRCNSASQ